MNVNYSNETSVDVGEMPAFRMLVIHQVIRIMCSVFGIPLNFLVVAVILWSRQLWSGWNIFWLAVTFFNFNRSLAICATKLSIYYLHRRGDGSHLTLCQIYSTFIGCPYSLLLSGLVLASWDRYLALARHHFYQHYATPRNVSFVTVFIVVTGGQTSPYWLGIFPIKCGLRFGWIAVALGFQGLLSIICLVQIKFYVFVRHCIHYPPPFTRTISSLPELVEHQVPK